MNGSLEDNFESLAQQLENLEKQAHDLEIRYTRGCVSTHDFHYQTAVYLATMSELYAKFAELHLFVCQQLHQKEDVNDCNEDTQHTT